MNLAARSLCPSPPRKLACAHFLVRFGSPVSTHRGTVVIPALPWRLSLSRVPLRSSLGVAFAPSSVFRSRSTGCLPVVPESYSGLRSISLLSSSASFRLVPLASPADAGFAFGLRLPLPSSLVGTVCNVMSRHRDVKASRVTFSTFFGFSTDTSSFPQAGSVL